MAIFTPSFSIWVSANPVLHTVFLTPSKDQDWVVNVLPLDIIVSQCLFANFERCRILSRWILLSAHSSLNFDIFFMIFWEDTWSIVTESQWNSEISNNGSSASDLLHDCSFTPTSIETSYVLSFVNFHSLFAVFMIRALISYSKPFVLGTGF